MNTMSYLGKVNARSVDELFDRVADATGWRKQELSLIRSLVVESIGSAKYTAIRSAVSLLYAHWEGAIKEISQSYMSYVAFKQLPYADLQENFAAIRLRRLHAQCQRSEKNSYYAGFLNDFTGFHDANMERLFYEEAINTESNLNKEVLYEIFFTIGFKDETQVFSLKDNLIDEVLLKNRNSIVHGDRITGALLIDQDRYFELHSGVVHMIDVFADEVLDMALGERYMR